MGKELGQGKKEDSKGEAERKQVPQSESCAELRVGSEAKSPAESQMPIEESEFSSLNNGQKLTAYDKSLFLLSLLLQPVFTEH